MKVFVSCLAPFLTHTGPVRTRGSRRFYKRCLKTSLSSRYLPPRAAEGSIQGDEVRHDSQKQEFNSTYKNKLFRERIFSRKKGGSISWKTTKDHNRCRLLLKDRMYCHEGAPASRRQAPLSLLEVPACFCFKKGRANRREQAAERWRWCLVQKDSLLRTLALPLTRRLTPFRDVDTLCIKYTCELYSQKRCFISSSILLQSVRVKINK